MWNWQLLWPTLRRWGDNLPQVAVEAASKCSSLLWGVSVWRSRRNKDELELLLGGAKVQPSCFVHLDDDPGAAVVSVWRSRRNKDELKLLLGGPKAQLSCFVHLDVDPGAAVVSVWRSRRSRDELGGPKVQRSCFAAENRSLAAAAADFDSDGD